MNSDMSFVCLESYVVEGENLHYDNAKLDQRRVKCPVDNCGSPVVDSEELDLERSSLDQNSAELEEKLKQIGV